MRHPSHSISAAAALAIVLALPGCGADEVDLNGKLFEAMGVSSNSQSKAKEPKMVARSPLVIPPSLDRLPQPGAPQQAQSSELAALADPDKAAVKNQADLERQQAEYCKIHYEIPKQQGLEEADAAEGPLGSCRGSVLTALKKISGIGQDDGDDQAGQVEK